MAEKLTLVELLKDTPPEKLDQPCQDELLCQISRHITDWPYLAPFMGISKPEEEEIVGEWPHSIRRQKLELLRTWQEKHGRKATYRELCKAFWKIGEIALSEKVCDIINHQGSISGSTFGDNGHEDINPSLPPKPTPRSRQLTSVSCLNPNPTLAPKPKPRSRQVMLTPTPPKPKPRSKQGGPITPKPKLVAHAHCPMLLYHTDPPVPTSSEADPLDDYIENL